MGKAISVTEILNRTFKEMPFEGEWKDCLGVPEMSGAWIVWGHSGNGKTHFTLMLAKYLCNFGRVAYNTLEEGARKSMQRAVKEVNMRPVARRFVLLDREPMDELRDRLSKRKSPDIVIIDSFQYSGMSKRDYMQLKTDFPRKLFIFISHAAGNNPEGRTANSIKYDADVKIRVEGYKAFPISRYGGGKVFTIWPEGAAGYWGE